MAVAQALLTALLSGLFSGFVLFGLNERRDRSDFILRKTEEAIEAYNALLASAQEFIWIHWDYGTAGNYAAASLKRDAAKRDLDLSIAKSRTLIAIYAPAHIQLVKNVTTVLGKFAPSAAEIIQGSIRGELYEEQRFAVIGKTALELVDAGDKASGIYRAARAIAHRPFILRRYNPRLPIWGARSKASPQAPNSGPSSSG
jgi:hypothetical protein